MYSNREEWEALLGRAKITKLPWMSQTKKKEGEAEEGEGKESSAAHLDELVIMKALSPESWAHYLSKTVQASITAHTSTMPSLPAILAEITEEIPSTSTSSSSSSSSSSSFSQVVILLYDEVDTLSQCNLTQLEGTLQDQFQVSQFHT